MSDKIINAINSESAHNWPEDYSHENGNYWNTCSVCDVKFVGHKRRVVCKVCANKHIDEIQRRANKSLDGPCEFCGKEHEIATIAAGVVNGRCIHPSLNPDGSMKCGMNPQNAPKAEVIDAKQFAALMTPHCVYPECERKACVVPRILLWTSRFALMKPLDRAFVFDMSKATYCRECADKLKAEDFLNDAAWERLVQKCQKVGATPPRRWSAQLKWLEMETKTVSAPKVVQADFKHAHGIPRFAPDKNGN